MTKLLGARVLVEQDNNEEKSAAGIYIAKTKEAGDFSNGVVVNIGEQLSNEMELKVGDKVVFQYGKTITVEGKQYQLVMADDVIAIL